MQPDILCEQLVSPRRRSPGGNATPDVWGAGLPTVAEEKKGAFQVSLTFDEWWKTRGGFLPDRRGTAVVIEAWSARQPEIDQLKAENSSLLRAAKMALKDLAEYEYIDLPNGYAVAATVRALRDAIARADPDYRPDAKPVFDALVGAGLVKPVEREPAPDDAIAQTLRACERSAADPDNKELEREARRLMRKLPDAERRVVQRQMTGEAFEVGDIVQVNGTGHDERDLMYRGWRGVVTGMRDGRAFVDSDAFVRRTGKLQAVSFRQWFSFDELTNVDLDASPSPSVPAGEAGGHK